MNPTKLRKTRFLSRALFLGIALPFLPSCVIDRGHEEKDRTPPSATSNRQVKLEDGVPLVIVNEFMASNATGITDEGGTTADWIELYNLSDEDIDLAGFFISDDEDFPTKALLPHGMIIEAHSTFLLWADGDTWQGPHHLPFKLKKAGEVILLTSPMGDLLDFVEFKNATTDTSFARFPDGTGDFALCSIPTPDAANDPACER